MHSTRERETRPADHRPVVDPAELGRTLRPRPQPPEGLAFRQATYEAIQRLDTGAQMLTQAYVDAGNGDTRAARTIVTAARDWMHRGRLRLGYAAQDIAALPTNNPNC